MKKSEIVTLYRYNAWANERILNAACNLTTEQFLDPAPLSYGGLRATLVHMLFAEWLWRRRWEGQSPTEWMAPEDFPTFDSLRTRWEREQACLLDFADQVSEEKLDQTVNYKTTTGNPRENVLWHMMLHVVNHGTQHRSEAAIMLTNFGYSPGDIDLIVFLQD